MPSYDLRHSLAVQGIIGSFSARALVGHMGALEASPTSRVHPDG